MCLGGGENLDEKQKTLGIKKGRGAKVKLEPVKELLPDLVKENARNLNAVLAILSENIKYMSVKLPCIIF